LWISDGAPIEERAYPDSNVRLIYTDRAYDRFTSASDLAEANIEITSITATRVEGTFSGTLFENSLNGVTVTEGQFRVARTN